MMSVRPSLQWSVAKSVTVGCFVVVELYASQLGNCCLCV